MVEFKVDEATLQPLERTLLRRLRREYTEDLVRGVLKPLLAQTSPVSLRVLDWIVTNYSKAHHVVCSSTATGQCTNVHQAYLTMLSYWRRRLFDPFRRRSRIEILIDDDVLVTTLGQANFALFAYSSGLYTWALGHLDAIEAHMNSVSREQKRVKRDAAARGERRKRTELTASAPAACAVYVERMRVHF